MPSLTVAKSAGFNWGSNIHYEPVGVFIGGTSGVGRAMAQAFHSYTGGKCHIIIIGRNRAAAESIFALMDEPTNTSIKLKREFIHCDVYLMKNIKETSRVLLALLPHINFLILSAGYGSILNDRDETVEGMAGQLVTRYYSRWRFIHELLPLMRNASEGGLDAKVMSVLGAQRYKVISVDLDDLALKKSYWGWKAAIQSVNYNDYMMEEYAIREPTIAFTHIYPGIVNTPAISRIFDFWLFRPFSPIFQALCDYFLVNAEDCASYMWYGLLDGEKGFFRRDNLGNCLGMQGYESSARIRQIVWDHSMRETDR
ncbi:NAD-P-binding protein [Collybia nuda]|uniref:NAD-P-binding protein n=1 Tax=Collybia nuda TaxID=64659 RepID=A0A9P5Y0N2_9AGAR|nr:NAD-P-binding protein [Collybia nuda]